MNITSPTFVAFGTVGQLGLVTLVDTGGLHSFSVSMAHSLLCRRILLSEMCTIISADIRFKVKKVHPQYKTGGFALNMTK